LQLRARSLERTIESTIAGVSIVRSSDRACQFRKLSRILNAGELAKLAAAPWFPPNFFQKIELSSTRLSKNQVELNSIFVFVKKLG